VQYLLFLPYQKP